MKDNRGTPIVVGCQVAYNYSGQIAVGTVRSITPTKITVELGIRINDQGIVQKPGKISIVKRRQNLIVLLGEEE